MSSVKIQPPRFTAFLSLPRSKTVLVTSNYRRVIPALFEITRENGAGVGRWPKYENSTVILGPARLDGGP